MTVCVVESENFSPISSGQGPFGGVGIETNSQNQICFFGFSHFSTLVDHHYDLDTTRKIQAHQEGQQKTPQFGQRFQEMPRTALQEPR